MHNTITGVDLAKDEIQVCVSKRNKVQANQAMTPEKFTSWLANAKPMTIVFETCSTSNYWKQLASEYGHDARLISAKLVGNVRQNQKTDKNDALAVVQAAQLTGILFINGKSKEQQELQTLARLRDLAVKHNAVRSCLVVGAMSAVNHATRRTAKTKKDLWIQQLVERKGKRCAAVALANKTVRTAFAMLTNNTEYKSELLDA
jgi:transposase